MSKFPTSAEVFPAVIEHKVATLADLDCRMVSPVSGATRVRLFPGALLEDHPHAKTILLHSAAPESDPTPESLQRAAAISEIAQPNISIVNPHSMTLIHIRDGMLWSRDETIDSDSLRVNLPTRTVYGEPMTEDQSWRVVRWLEASRERPAVPYQKDIYTYEEEKNGFFSGKHCGAETDSTRRNPGHLE